MAVRGLQRIISRARSTAAVERDLYDVVIVGGGMVGSALACALGREPLLSSHRILVLEGSSSPPVQVSRESPFSNRVCSISNGSVELLKSVGVWDEIRSVRAKPYNYMYVWDSDTESRIAFSPAVHCDDEESSPPAIAHIVENDLVLHALHERLLDLPNVELRRGSRVRGLSLPGVWVGQGEEWVKVHLEGGCSVDSRLLVGADGSQSQVRHLGGFQTVEWKYNQFAVVATLELLEAGSNNTAWQRFLPTGPVAILPLSENLSSLVWSTSPDHAKRLVAMGNTEFVDALNSALFDKVLSGLLSTAVRSLVRAVEQFGGSLPPHQLPPAVTGVLPHSRACFPLALLHTPSYVCPRVALVGTKQQAGYMRLGEESGGDSAHRVHPLAGLGVNLGFGDVTCLRDTVTTTVSQGGDIGGDHSLLHYQSHRLRHNLPVMGTIDLLHRLYTTKWPPAVAARSVGLQLVEAVKPLKALLMSGAERLN